MATGGVELPLPSRLPRAAVAPALVLVAGDVVLWGLSCYLAFLLRFEGLIPMELAITIPLVLSVTIPIRLAWFSLFRLYQITWRQVGITEVIRLGKASSLAALTLAGGLLLLRDTPVFGALPRSVVILDFVLGAAFSALLRLWWRLRVEFTNGGVGRRHGTRVLLVGAGAGGERVVRSMLQGELGARRAVGCIDDDRAKHGAYIHGVKVLGGRAAIPDAVRRLAVDEVVIAVPSAPVAAIRDIVRYTRQAGVKQIKVLPSINDFFASKALAQGIRDINLEDLLGRESVRLDPGRVDEVLAGLTVLVTGAGGSIGSELVRQLGRSEAARLILVDQSESALFELEGQPMPDRPVPERHALIADVRDTDKMRRIFQAWKPDVVYHAAAYKHVPLMEANVDEAVRTNVFGTLTLAEAALSSGTRTFLLISTDKAVNPSSVMGATKRFAELLIKALNARGETRFTTVRFGNVIGSRGSVIPVMMEQIRRGGPVTVTDPEMTRYFMSTQEAVALVLQASAMKEPREVYTLDMGEPVKILDLAEELIRMAGFEPDKEIPIVFTGIRPGEKLHEILQMPDEPLEPTEVPKISALTSTGRVDEIILRFSMQELDRLSRSGDVIGLRTLLRRLTDSHGYGLVGFERRRGDRRRQGAAARPVDQERRRGERRGQGVPGRAAPVLA